MSPGIALLVLALGLQIGGAPSGFPVGTAAGGADAIEDRLSPEERAWVEAVADGLTLEQKVAQLLVPWLEGGRPATGSRRWERAVRLAESGVGGFIVGAGPGQETAEWLAELQGRAPVPLLVAADLEWGAGARLEGATVLPMNMALAAAGDARLAYEAGRITALEARAAGIHVALAPVADVNVNPLNPVINTRSFGSDARAVADRVAAFVEGARSGGLLTVVKHFPGHGDTETDSHLALPVLTAGRARLDAVELRPFDAAIRAGVDGVMTGHLAVPALDPAGRPATLSPAIQTDLLRGDLGFGGLVVTDGLHMDGVKASGDAGAVAVGALAAGADLLLIPPDEDRATAAVVGAVRSGRLGEARIDESVRRVLAAKALAGLARSRDSLPAATAALGRVDHALWSRWITERSLTAPRAAPGALPLRLRGRPVLLVVYDDRRGHVAGGTLERELGDRGANVRVVRLARDAGAVELDGVRQLAGQSDLVLFASFSRAVPWRGRLGLPDAVAGLAAGLAAAGAPVLAFGDPYLLRQLPEARTYLVAWDRTAVTQESVVRALAGEIPITGRLPIDLPPDHSVGDGLVVPMAPLRR